MSNPSSVNGAPVCNMPTEPVFPAPSPPVLPPLPPPASDLPSALHLINQIRQIVIQMGNMVPDNNQGGGGGAGRPGQSFSVSGSKKQGNFQEVRARRVTKKTRVFNPDDNSQFVDVEQIVSQTFQNGLGQTITWNQ